MANEKRLSDPQQEISRLVEHARREIVLGKEAADRKDFATAISCFRDARHDTQDAENLSYILRQRADEEKNKTPVQEAAERGFNNT